MSAAFWRTGANCLVNVSADQYTLNISKSPHTLTTPETEWLSLIRYQLLMAVEQSRASSPLNTFAINSLQDCVEAMLSLLAQSLGASLRNRADFDKLFDGVITETLSGDADLLQFRPSLLALNTARVAFKHHGNLIQDVTIRRHSDRADEFVHIQWERAFGINLDTVSLLVFIANDNVRGLIEQSQRQVTAGDFPATMESLRLAFDTLVDDYISRKVWHPGKTLFTTKPSFMPSKRDLKFLGIEKLADWIDSIDEWVRYLSLGIDMRRYAFFDAHTPSIMYAMGGNHFTNHRVGVVLTDEVYKRAFKFVVDTALSFAVDDFDFDAWSVRRAAASDA